MCDNGVVALILGLSSHDHLLQLLLLYLENGNGLLEELLKVQDILLVLREVRYVLLLIDFEVRSILLKDLKWGLSSHHPEDLVYFAFFSCKDTEFLRVSEVLEFRNFLHEALEQGSPLFDEVVVFVSHEFLFRDCRNVNTRPPRGQHVFQCVELRVTPGFFEGTLLVDARNSVFDVTANLDRVEDSELCCFRVLLLENVLETAIGAFL